MEALAAGRRLSAREEERLGLLAGFPDGSGGEYGSDRELSFSDLVDAGGIRTSEDAASAAPTREARKGHESAPSPVRQEAASRQQQQQQAAAREKRRRARRSGGSRGSCGGGGDGVLLNFYVPGLLTRSMTAPRPGRGAPPPAAAQSSPAKAATVAAAGKASGSSASGHRMLAGVMGPRPRPTAAGQGIQLAGREDEIGVRAPSDHTAQPMLPAPPNCSCFIKS
ncbi:hypothetical protein ACP70R_040386 [Stipagrostis hirtigluma subsp. patula]